MEIPHRFEAQQHVSQVIGVVQNGTEQGFMCNVEWNCFVRRDTTV